MPVQLERRYGTFSIAPESHLTVRHGADGKISNLGKWQFFHTTLPYYLGYYRSFLEVAYPEQLDPAYALDYQIKSINTARLNSA
jgi:hypothetical protein